MRTGQAIFKRSALYIALSSTIALPSMANAQTDEQVQGIERIQVTGSRRTLNIQNAPINISALDEDIIAQQNITDLNDIANWTPGLSIPDQGARGDDNIIIRGLSTSNTGPESDGGTVGTYFSEIPMNIDVRLIDVERIEVLKGPQGTLYGSGTLAGAIRYIPKKAILDEKTLEFSYDAFKGSESDSYGKETSFKYNVPLIDNKLALRASVNYFDDPGFIDYLAVVKEGGVSDPNVSDLSSDTLSPVNDANGEKILTTQIALRFKPNDKFEATLTYLYQKQKVAGNSLTNYQSLSVDNPLQPAIGKYTSAARYLEPETETDTLLSLELVADLDFAELTSATAFTKTQNSGQRDVTDLLIANNWSYENFPNFSAFSRDSENNNTFSQEIRLTSKENNSKFSWLVGGFYGAGQYTSYSAEYTPNYAEFIDSDRTDDLEYLLYYNDYSEETALFGEISYQVTPKLALSAGVRFYNHLYQRSDANVTPFFGWEDSLIGGINDPLQFNPESISSVGNDESGAVYKFNAGYQLANNILLYTTYSEGYRPGAKNGLVACPDVIGEDENLTCALPHEYEYKAEKTHNYEFGLKSNWINNKLHFNVATYYVDWEDIQVAGGSTENGYVSYITNAGNARSQGIEISTRAILSDNLSIFNTLAYNDAELTENDPSLFKQLDATDPAFNEYSAQQGDRLSGAPRKQGTFGLHYSQEILQDKMLDITYGITYQSDIYTRVGMKAEGERLAGYTLHNISAKVSNNDWAITLYVDNLFDKYAFSATRSNGLAAGYADFPDQIKNPATVDQYRGYKHYIIRPLTAGVKFNYLFDL